MHSVIGELVDFMQTKKMQKKILKMVYRAAAKEKRFVTLTTFKL